MVWKAQPLDPADETFWRDWTSLTDASASAHPVCDAAYVRAALLTFATAASDLWSLRLMADNGACAALAILRRSRLGRWSTYRIPALPVAPFLSLPNALDGQSLEAAVRALPGRAWRLRVYDCDPAYHASLSSFGSPSLLRLEDHATIYIDTTGSFEAYWAARPRRLRNSINAGLRKLGGEETGAIVLRVVREPQEMASAVANHAELEASGWKGKRGSALSVHDPYGRFYREILQEFARRGAARVYRLERNGTLIASQLCVIAGGTLATMKTAYLASAASCGPGRVLDYLMLRDQANDAAVSRVEYCVHASKSDLQWATQARTLQQIDLLPLPPLARLTRFWRTIRGRREGRASVSDP